LGIIKLNSFAISKFDIIYIFFSYSDDKLSGRPLQKEASHLSNEFCEAIASMSKSFLKQLEPVKIFSLLICIAYNEMLYKIYHAIHLI
jgi:hypothetical protein